MFTIVETRHKSYKLKGEDDVTFFVPKRWVRKDGTFTPAVQKNYEKRRVELNYRNERIPVNPDWESEKCYGLDYRVTWCGPSSMRSRVFDKRMRVFVPKKAATEDGLIARWKLQSFVDDKFSDFDTSLFTVDGRWKETETRIHDNNIIVMVPEITS